VSTSNRPESATSGSSSLYRMRSDKAVDATIKKVLPYLYIINSLLGGHHEKYLSSPDL
jgi:hypothetical protein